MGKDWVSVCQWVPCLTAHLRPPRTRHARVASRFIFRNTAWPCGDWQTFSKIYRNLPESHRAPGSRSFAQALSRRGRSPLTECERQNLRGSRLEALTARPRILRDRPRARRGIEFDAYRHFFPAAMRRFSSSNQFWTTTICRAPWSSSAAFSIRKCWPSDDTS
jgi:hypothetical protein